MPGTRQWQSIDYHFPEIASTPVMVYANPAWAVQDTTLDHAARTLWEALQAGGTGFVASSIRNSLTSALEARSPEFTANGAHLLKKEVLFKYSDTEQDLTEYELESWRWVDPRMQDTSRPSRA